MSCTCETHIVFEVHLLYVHHHRQRCFVNKIFFFLQNFVFDDMKRFWIVMHVRNAYYCIWSSFVACFQIHHYNQFCFINTIFFFLIKFRVWKHEIILNFLFCSFFLWLFWNFCRFFENSRDTNLFFNHEIVKYVFNQCR